MFSRAAVAQAWLSAAREAGVEGVLNAGDQQVPLGAVLGTDGK